jgi:TIR domain/SIR2-like domain
MNISPSPALKKPLWDDALWALLLDYISRGQVIPIVGPALSTITVEGRELTIQQYVAEQLAQSLSLRDVPPAPTLNDVVSCYLRENQRDELYVLYSRTGEIFQKTVFTPPDALLRLARISHFKMFVTTAFDPLLETAVNQVRFGGEQLAEVIRYVPNDAHDIDPVRIKQAPATIFHLLGRVSCIPNEYVISDEDFLEFVFALQEHPPERLFNELESKHLLILGGNLPDWVARLFLRSTKGRRLSDSRQVYEILADNVPSDTKLVSFLSDFSTRTKVFTGGAPQFIEQLWMRWKERFGESAGEAKPVTSGAPERRLNAKPLFISYSHPDRDAALTLKAELEAAGFAVWLDTERLGGGAAYDAKILSEINDCSLFIAVLSQNTEERKEGYFRTEWNYALDRLTRFDRSDVFIVPVVVDDTDGNTSRFKRVPPGFRFLTGQALPGGQVTPQFVQTLKSYIAES